MRSNIIRTCIAGVVFVLIASPLLRAQATTPQKMDSFTGTTINLNPGAGVPLRINVFKWANDTERDALLAAFTEKDASQLGAWLEKAPTIGYIWGDGPIGYSLRYAQKIQQPDGSERIILLTDRPLGSWSREGWKPSGQSAALSYPFTLVELRLNKQGRGAGKTSLAAKLTTDSDVKAVTLENYAAAPVHIDDVRRITSSS